MKTDAYTNPCFSLGNRLARAIWSLVYTLCFRFSPRPLHGWRSFLLRCFGAKLGKGCHIYPRAVIWAPWNLECDDEACIADQVIVYNMDQIKLGYRAVVSQGCHLCGGTHDYESPRFELLARPITIGRMAWICADSFVGPGIAIGEGAVIGARSVVTKDMPPWMVCTGHPCKPLKERKIRADKS